MRFIYNWASSWFKHVNWEIPDCCILMTHISWIIKVVRSAQLSIEKLGSPSESLQRCTNHPWNIFARNFTYNVMELLFSSNHGFHHATITFISFDKKFIRVFLIKNPIFDSEIRDLNETSLNCISTSSL